MKLKYSWILSKQKIRVLFSIIFFTSIHFLFAKNQNQAFNSYVEIKRDNYGVPHIYADTTYDLFYGYGYAVAEDRLFQTDMSRRSFVGRVAEVLGRGEDNKYLNYDINVHKNYSVESIQAQLDALSEENRSIFRGYADGFNAYLQNIEKNPDLMPLQYIKLGFLPEPLFDFDVLMIWTGSMANRFSDVNLEISNYSLLMDLQELHGEELGLQVFNEFRWIGDSSSPSTARIGRMDESVQITDTLYEASSMLKEHTKDLSLRELNQQLLSWKGQGVDAVPRASNVWITSPNKTTDQSTVLINGPQFGWYNPSYVYGIGLHGAGFNVVGNTPFAYPAILFATNGEVAWGSTAGPQDVVDIYQEQLNPDNIYEYYFDGAYKKMRSRNVLISIKDEDSKEVTFWSTIHGPVIDFDEDNNVAYSKKRAWDGYEAQSLLAWIHSMKSQNWGEFQDYAKKVAISINWYYADKDGNIGYLSPGYLPDRPQMQDIRIPAMGDGTMEWEGILDFTYTPKSYNPKESYIINWNNLPAPDKNNTDAYYWTYADRVNELDALYQTQEKFSPDELWAFNKKASYVDVNYRYFKDYLKELLVEKNSSIGVAEAEMLQLLLNWDGYHLDQNRDHLYDHPGRLIFETWLEEFYTVTLLAWLPDSYHEQYRATGFSRADTINPGSVNLSMATKVVLRQLALQEELENGNYKEDRFDLFQGKSISGLMNEALIKTYANLQERYGKDMTLWYSPIAITTFSENNFTGIPQGLNSEKLVVADYHNRGTENNRIIFSSDGVEFCDVVAPGQSGFISARGIKSPNYNNQMEIYFDFRCKIHHFSNDREEVSFESEIKLYP